MDKHDHDKDEDKHEKHEGNSVGSNLKILILEPSDPKKPNIRPPKNQTLPLKR